jgi:hypothetical protein
MPQCDIFAAKRSHRVTVSLYFNESLNHFSCIDRSFMSDKLRRSIIAINVVDSGINLSDHRPLIATLSLSYEVDSMLVKSHKARPVTYSWWWDKADLFQYECQTHANLVHAVLPVDCLSYAGCTDECNLSAIDNYKNEIVTALQDAAFTSIPRIPTCSLKPYWNDEVEWQKEDGIFWHNLWVSSGRPSGSCLHLIKSLCKLEYKRAIKDAYSSYENSIDDELLKFYTNKHMPEFWKVWNAKFKRGISNQIHVIGCKSDADTANIFANKFSTVYCDSMDSGDAMLAACFNTTDDRPKLLQNSDPLPT